MFGTIKDASEDNGGKSTDEADNTKNINNNKSIDVNKRNSSTSSSFLNWINRFNNSNNNTFNKSTTASSLSEIIDQENSINDEYKGIQGLKEFWNNKLTLLKSKPSKSATLDGTHRKFSSLESNLTSSKSVSCLITHDHSFSFDDSLDENCIRNRNHHLKSDNFYKYKNASTKKRLSLCDGLNNSKNNLIDSKIKIHKVDGIGINFPLIASTPTGEKIHWAKREDLLFLNRTNSKNQQDLMVDGLEKVINKQTELSSSFNKQQAAIICNNCDDDNDDDDKKCLHMMNETDDDCDKNSQFSLHSHNIEMTTKSSHEMDTLTTKEITIITDKTDSGKSNDGSINSLSSDSPFRKKNPASRKYSFKTHAKTYYSPSRKMLNHNGGSKVAALTHQFNQLVQKDSAILKEIKKKNGVLITTGGHVYKVKEEFDNGRKKSIKKDTGGDDVSLKSGKRKITAKKSNNINNNSKGPKCNTTELSSENGTVKAVVKKFENQDCSNKCVSTNRLLTNSSVEKPKVPIKSEQVLRRTKEIVLRNNQKKSKVIIDNVTSRVEIPARILEETVEDTTNSSEDVNRSSVPETIEEHQNSEKTETEALDALDSNHEMGREENTSNKNDEIEENGSKKSKYSRLYEKIKFRTPFFKKNSSDNHSSSSSPPHVITEQSDYKIVDALKTVNKRLEHLSKSANNLCTESKIQNNEERTYEELKAKMKPNESFLFRGNSRLGLTPDGDDNSEIIIEAVNSRLINKTQSMDETNFTSLLQFRQISIEEHNYTNMMQKADEIIDKFKHSNDDEEEDHYEPIEISNPLDFKTTESNQTSFLYKSESISKKDNHSRVAETIDDEDNIYQTVAEARNEISKNRNSIGSYESLENYESVPDDEDDDENRKSHENEPNKTLLEDGYDICDPPEPPPPRKTEGESRNSSDELPPLPAPKRIFANNSNNASSYEYKKPLLLSFKKEVTNQENSPLPSIPSSTTIKSTIKRVDINDDDEHCYDDENIYDTIKGAETLSHCYESLNSKHNSTSLDIVSVSNCYESISSLRRNAVLRHSDSISTLSSDQKTNSLYGMTLGQQRSSINDGSSDDNSDGWVDISDGEENSEQKDNKHQFIVVRERNKCHKSPDWSKRVRDQRSQQKTSTYIDDDSDHYYEPLYTKSDANENTTTTINNDNETMATNDRRPQLTQLIMPNVNYQNPSSIIENSFSDDYDSFDSDDESDEEVKKNDSGVDISNTKLPDPPPSTNHVYAFVKKMKNLISSKKSSPRSSSSLESSSKPYENTQFYVAVTPEYQNTTMRLDKKNKSSRSSKVKSSKSCSKLEATSDGLYENAEFHTPRIPIISTAQSPSENTTNPITSPLPLISSKIENTGTEDIPNTPPQIIARKKSKSGKSFKSKLRKSLGGVDTGFSIGSSTLNATRSTFYISDSVDVDSGIFEKNPSSDTNLSPAASTEQCDDAQKTNNTITRKTKKNHNSPELNRRKTTVGMRPLNPPPPPPVDKKSQKKRTPSTSWYAECGVFKSNTNNDELMLKDGRGERSNTTSWYAEAGLYQTSGASVASSSGSSGVSTGGENGPGDDNSHSMFSNEPLYQIYSAAKLESISRDMEDQDSMDGYEEIGTHNRSSEQRKSSRPSALQLVGPKQGPSRTLWSEIPEVVNSGILGTLTPTERRLQEAKFEILTSEASYLKSLNLLKTHFMNHPAFRDTSVLSSSDRKALFSYIVPVHECSDRLLCDLENCWQDNIMLLGLSKSLYKHAEKYFHVYISFCEHQGKMDRTLRKLKENKGSFSQTLDMLETDPACCGLNLHSFLMLPMQRITRLPLLIDAVFSKVKQDDDEYEDWKITLAILNKIVSQCNDAANRCEQAYEIEKISRQIEFPSNIRALAIAPVGVSAPGKKPRFLVKKGEIVHLIWRGDDAKLTFGKKFTKCNIFLFLFTDLLVLTKKKGDDQYTVFDYCPRSMITVSSGDSVPQLPTKEISQAGKNLFLLTLLENHEGKTIEMILSCPSVSEQQRWLQALSPPESENPDEKLYEQWDCPQVVTIHQFSATESDLLSLEPGDVVNVTRKMADGWYQGERIRDGATGWFPGSYTEEVNSPHVRARNLKQRYRLLTFTASYLETIKRNNKEK